MPYGDVFEALGGGLVGLLGVVVVLLSIGLIRLVFMIFGQYEARLRERDARIEKQDKQLEELTRAVNRQSDVIESWMPEAQRRRLRS